jgi:large subunit ribosomal protein L24
MRLKVGDNVIVVAGKDKGKKGVITKVMREENRVVVDGVNVMKKHRKARQEGAENIIEFSAPVHASNVMFFDAKAKKPTRIGVKKVDGKNVRITKKSETQLK